MATTTKELFKRVNLAGHHDLLWELDNMCPCGSGKPFKGCCGGY